jgi:hypothetical protein
LLRQARAAPHRSYPAAGFGAHAGLEAPDRDARAARVYLDSMRIARAFDSCFLGMITSRTPFFSQALTPD